MKIKSSIKEILWIVTTTSVIVAANPVDRTVIRGQGRDWIVGQTVHTSSGYVAGQAALEAEQVSQYLGIPYAQPPIGSLRFQPPTRFNGSSIINATAFVSCIFSLRPAKGLRLSSSSK
jgi:hypothetical protein